MKLLVITGFIANVLLGNFCMMPMAMASGMPVPHDMDAMDEMMTPIAPMSHADCEHCPHHSEKKEPTPQSSSCAGHCLSQATSTNPSNVSVGTMELVAVLPTLATAQWDEVENAVVQPAINPSPPRISTDTVVLRL